MYSYALSLENNWLYILSLIEKKSNLIKYFPNDGVHTALSVTNGPMLFQ